MKKFLFLLIVTKCFLGLSQSDTILTKPDIRKNSFYLELVGNPTLYAVNYDRILLNTTYVSAYATVGTTYIFGENSLNSGVKKTIEMPDELNHAKYILGGSLMFRKELFWKMFNIDKVAKDKKNRVAYWELGFFHIWNDPNLSPSNRVGGTMERANPWNNIYIGYNLYRTRPGIFLRFGAMIYMFKKGPNVIDEMSGFRISPLPFPRLIVGYTF